MPLIPVFLFAASLPANLAITSRTTLGECAFISDVASARTRWPAVRGGMLLIGVVLCIAVMVILSGSARAGVTLEQRKLPMKFSWVACQPNCRGWISAIGIVTEDTPRKFDEFARGRQLGGATIVLDSRGGIEPSPIQLKVRQFLHSGVPVYLPVDPTLS
jgi:hypothetical protein